MTGRTGSASGAWKADPIPAGARCARGRCQRKYQPPAAAAAAAASSHRKEKKPPDCVGAGACSTAEVSAASGAVCDDGRVGAVTAEGALATAFDLTVGSGAAFTGERSAVCSGGVGRESGTGAGLAVSIVSTARVGRWGLATGGFATGCGCAGWVTLPPRLKLLSCGGPIESPGADEELVEGSFADGALCANAAVLAEASAETNRIRQSGCIIPRSFSDLAIPPRGAHGLLERSIQAQLALTGVDQHQFGVFLCLNRHALLTLDRNPIPSACFDSVYNDRSAGNQVEMPLGSGRIFDGLAAFH